MSIKISNNRIGRAFMGRQVGRKIGEFLDLIDPKIITDCINTGKLLTDYMPEEKKYEFKSKVAQYYEAIESFTVDEAYLFLPREYREFIEGHEGGKEWAIGQLQAIKDFLLST